MHPLGHGRSRRLAVPLWLLGLLLAPPAVGRGAGSTTLRVSVDSAGAQGNDVSSSPSSSANGRFVAFQSDADNLVPGDTKGFADVFVRG
jgi:hypothetical protein